MKTKLFALAILTLAITAGTMLFLLLVPSNYPAQAAPGLQQAITTRPVWETLDTNGDGTGTTNATGNYTTSTTFYLEPPAASVYVINRLIANIEDSAVISYNLYGAITTTNGVVVRRVSGSTVVTLTNSIPITANQVWSRYCTVKQTSINDTNLLQAICELGEMQLNGDRSERLEIVLNDDYTGLVGHFFVAQGYKR